MTTIRRLIAAADNKIWFGRNESNPSQFIPVLLTNTGVLRTDMNFSKADIWNTNIGQLTNANATQFENSGGALSIVISWLNSAIGDVACLLTGCDIVGDLSVTGNITSDSFFIGDGSLLTGIVSGLWTNVSGVATYDGNVNITQNLTIGGCTTWYNGTHVIEDC